MLPLTNNPVPADLIGRYTHAWKHILFADITRSSSIPGFYFISYIINPEPLLLGVTRYSAPPNRNISPGDLADIIRRGYLTPFIDARLVVPEGL